MNLDKVPSGQPVTLDRPAVPPSRARRLAELGLRVGSTVTPLHRTAGGGRVIRVGTARIAVARAVLSRFGLHEQPSAGPAEPEPPEAGPAAAPPDGASGAGASTSGAAAAGAASASTPRSATAVLTRPTPGGCGTPGCADGANPPTEQAPPTVGGSGTPRRPVPTVRGCHSDSGGHAPADAAIVALAGSPNVGKSTLFNALTGARRQVGNWPGTTVEVGRGAWRAVDRTVALVDLPGTHSLDPVSPDEQLTRALLVDAPPQERPDLVVVVVNTADAGRGLYLLSQVREREQRAVVALTMSDIGQRHGLSLDAAALERAVGVPVVSLDPRHRRGVDVLAPAVQRALEAAAPAPVHQDLAGPDGAPADDLDLADARFAWVNAAVQAATRRTGAPRRSWSERIDRVATSPVIGPLLFLAVMWGVFQLTTVGAAPLVDGLDRLVSGPVTDAAVRALQAVGLAGGWVEGLIVDGLIAGVGMVLTFVPLMTLMFILLALLEDSGYLARAAVVADRLMRTVGLPGRAFVPLIVGFGCNVPAVSATRVLPDARHRLLTALVVPFTSCSARLPVYVLVSAAVFGADAGNVVFGMYVASVALVIVGGLLLRATVLRGVRQEPLVLDLPDYQVPVPRLLLSATWTRLMAFLRTATGVIVVTVAAVWLLSAVPAGTHTDGGFGTVAVEDSAFASVSSAIAPVFAPAGFGEWHTAGALLVGFVAKEAVVSSWAQTYTADEPADLHRPGLLGDAVRADFTTSSHGHPQLAGLAFMLFVLGYAPCVATMTAQLREIGLRWTLTGIALNLSLSWVVAVAVFQVGRLVL